eukprot:4167700-Pleurochrysis_carterae.AAC.2
MQPQVSVATSRALQASAEPSVWTEGVAFPAAVPGSGSISLAMGVGRLPAVAAVADTLGANWKDATDKYATVAIGVVAAVAMLQPYYPAQGVSVKENKCVCACAYMSEKEALYLA